MYYKKIFFDKIQIYFLQKKLIHFKNVCLVQEKDSFAIKNFFSQTENCNKPNSFATSKKFTCIKENYFDKSRKLISYKKINSLRVENLLVTKEILSSQAKYLFVQKKINFSKIYNFLYFYFIFQNKNIFQKQKFVIPVKKSNSPHFQLHILKINKEKNSQK